MRDWKLALLLAALLALSACNLTRQPPTTEPVTAQPDGGSKPVVTISAPQDGEEFVVGSDVFVSANASDVIGVTRVQLIANNQIVKTVTSETPGGGRSMNVLLDFRPSAAGDVRLQVVAFRGAVASDPAIVDITVRASQAQVTATVAPQTRVPDINPNDPTCRALVNIGLNLRTGPGTQFDRITVLPAGTVMPITGRIGSNQWWQVRFGGTIGWVAAAYVTVYGICTGVPVIATPAPPPTFPPTFAPPPTIPPTFTRTPVPPTPGLPDLVVASIVGPTTLTIPAGETTVSGNYSVTIANTGSGGTGQFANSITVLPGGTAQDLGVVSSLGAGESIALTQAMLFDAPGNYTLRVLADSDSQVNEISEVNNIGTLDVVVQTAP
jgi:hypothetical protein